MTDGSNIQDPVATPPQEPPDVTSADEAPPVDVITPKPAGVRGFVGSPTGRVVLIAAGIALVAGIAIIVALIALNAFSTPSTTVVVTKTPTGSVTVTSSATSSSVVATGANAFSKSNEPTAPPPPLGEVADSDVFVPRDPFSKPRVPTALPNGNHLKSSGDEEALVVLDIVNEDGELHAVLLVNGTKYTVSAGQRVGSTPWQVVRVYSDGVTILYGDQKLSILVGQGIAP